MSNLAQSHTSDSHALDAYIAIATEVVRAYIIYHWIPAKERTVVVRRLPLANRATGRCVSLECRRIWCAYTKTRRDRSSRMDSTL